MDSTSLLTKGYQMPSLSKRTELVIQSEIRSMTLECNRAGGINLAQGVCDLEVPPPVREGAQRAINEGFNIYTRYDGLPILREAIANKMETQNGLVVDPDSEVIVSSGSTGIFYSTCLALLDPGDEVILFEPFYQYHLNTLLSLGVIPRFVTTSPPNWDFDYIHLENAINDKTKAIIINTPSNPSGKVFNQNELKLIAKVVQENDLFLITDEIYEHFVYDGNIHTSPATIPGLLDHTITITGASKIFSITGWRIGYSISNAKWAKIIGYMNDLVYVCAPSPLQVGVAKGLEELSPEYYSNIRDEFAIKREKICNSLSKAGLNPYKPQGAYYVLADVSSIPGSTSKEKAIYLLSETGVAGVPGSAFYNSSEGENLMRFCYAKTDDDLEEACRRLETLSTI